MPVKVFGIPFNDKNTEEIVNEINENFQKKTITLAFVNAHCVNIFHKNAQYRKALQGFDLVLNDGVGLDIAAYRNGLRFRDNLNGTDLIPKIFEILTTKSSLKVVLIGTTDQRLGEAKKTMEKRYQNLKIIKTFNGFNDLEKIDKITDFLVSSNANVVLLGAGVPKQELTLQTIKSLVNQKMLYIAGGAIIDFFSQEISRAPKFFRVVRMEWFYRFLLEPKRLFKRYFVGNFEFLFRVIINRKF